MDFITQNLLGAVAGHAALGRRTEDGRGLGRLALLAGAVGGALPDFDFLLQRFADPALPMELHRHFTHSLVFIPVGGLLAALPLLVIPRCRRQFRLTLIAATIGLATHGLLDNLTSYGTHLLWPFVGHRTAWDSMSIIDPIFTLVLLLGVIAALVRGRPRPTRISMATALLYIGFGFVQHGRAVEAQRQIAAHRGHEIERGRTGPTLGNLIVFRSIYVAEGRLWADAVRVAPLGATTVREGTSMPLFTSADLPAEASPRAWEAFAGMSMFADGFTGRVEADTTDEIIIADMRISMTTAGFWPLWGIAIDTAAQHAVAWDSFGPRNEEAGPILRRMRDDVLAPGLRFQVLPESVER